MAREPAVYIFEDIGGRWRVTISDRGGKAPSFASLEDAKAEADRKSEKYALPVKILK